MKYNKEWAVEAAKQGVQVMAFYGHVQTGETVDASCLSQWFPWSFVTEGETYTTAEQYMMAEKAKLFGDEEIRQQILRERDPMTCKRLGRKVRDFEKEVWDARCGDIVVAGNIAKFSQNPEMKAFLMATGNAIWRRRHPGTEFWGTAWERTTPWPRTPATGKGKTFWFALMDAGDACGTVQLFERDC